jgi:hypothetical protein
MLHTPSSHICNYQITKLITSVFLQSNSCAPPEQIQISIEGKKKAMLEKINGVVVTEDTRCSESES